MTRWGVVTCLLAAVAVSLPSAAAAAPERTRAGDVFVTSGIAYGQGRVSQPAARDADLLLDLYEPVRESKRLRPAVVVIHGGGFVGGARTSPDLVRIARALARRGIVTVSISYRLIPSSPVLSSRVAALAAAAPDASLWDGMVAAVDDTLTALDWLEGRAEELRIDLARLGIAGSSAGAITAAHVAYILDDYEIDAPRFRFVGDLWGGILIPPSAESADRLEAGEARLFVVHGTADGTVPILFDDALVARARAVGVPVKYHRIAGAGHGFGATGFFTRKVSAGATAFDRLLAFTRKSLR